LRFAVLTASGLNLPPFDVSYRRRFGAQYQSPTGSTIGLITSCCP